MKFLLGLPPQDPEFQTADGGWQLLREPSPAVSCWVVGMLLGIALAVVVYALATFGFDFSIDNAFERYAPPELLIAFILLIALHEIIHALFHPEAGCSKHTCFGFAPKLGAFWTHYTGPISRNRMLLFIFMPFMALSVLPLGLCALLPELAQPLALCAICNAAVSSVDLFNCGMLAWQIPAEATVRNNGWETWWRLPASTPV